MACSSPLLRQSLLFDTQTVIDGYSLKMAANRYALTDAPQDGVTLLFAHANGTNKEYWEPTLESLLLTPHQGSSSVKLSAVREAWAFDWQDHGESAIENAAVLSNLKDGVSVVEWAKAIATFVETRLSAHRIVVIGHSAGSVAIVYSMLCFPPEARIPYVAVVIIEPPMHDKKLRDDNYDDRTGHIKILAKAVSMQRSQHDSRAAAYEWMVKRSPWKAWDDRVRRSFVIHGLRPVDPHQPDGRVTTKCFKGHEVAKFHEWDPMFRAVDHIGKACQQVPFHFIFGAVNDIVPRYVQDNAVDASRGRKVASVRRIPGVGHMVVQQKPDALAECIREILDTVKPKESHRLHRL